jgi:PadR family transcriptional regulator, regulatory protein PadR
MPDGIRITVNVAKVLRVLLISPAEPSYGYEVMSILKLKSGQVYPVLARLAAAGWVECRAEPIDPAAEGRPPRRYYLMTPHGVAQARDALARLRAELRPQA